MSIAMMSVAQFCRFAQLGKTTTYKLINEGQLDVAKIGRRTLITAESARALIEQSLVKKGEA